MSRTPKAGSDNITAALLMMASMVSFTLNDTMMKLMAGDVGLFQVIFLRGILTTAAVAIIAWRMGILRFQLPARDWRLIAVRTLADIATAYFFLSALFNMPLANVTAILQALPLTITLAAWAFLKEPVGWRRLLAIAIGLVGVLLIIRPGTEDFSIYSLYGLAAVCSVTVRDLTTRSLSEATPSMLVTFFTSLAVMIAFGLLSLGSEWTPMLPRSWALTSAAAMLIIGAYLFSIMVMRKGDIAFVAPFRYTGIVWALALGYLVFGDWPSTVTLIGAGIVVSSGLFMLYREARLSRKVAAIAERAET